MDGTIDGVGHEWIGGWMEKGIDAGGGGCSRRWIDGEIDGCSIQALLNCIIDMLLLPVAGPNLRLLTRRMCSVSCVAITHSLFIEGMRPVGLAHAPC